MAKIDLPRIEWLYRNESGKLITNPYSGSLGTQTSRGCVSVCTFNYRVFAENQALIASCFLIQPFQQGSEKTNHAQKSFDATPDGVNLASEWFSQMAESHGF